MAAWPGARGELWCVYIYIIPLQCISKVKVRIYETIGQVVGAYNREDIDNYCEMYKAMAIHIQPIIEGNKLKGYDVVEDGIVKHKILFKEPQNGKNG